MYSILHPILISSLTEKGKDSSISKDNSIQSYGNHRPAYTMADLPPSYNEVVKNPSPSAPRLNDIAGNSHSKNAQGQPSLPSTVHCPHVHVDEQFESWDDRATKILIRNRLDLNESFERANDQQEREELWDTILNRLLESGYSFERIELIQFWEFQCYIYKSIVNNLEAGTQNYPNWQYFEAMDNVFKHSTESRELNIDGRLANRRSIRDGNGVRSDPVITSQPSAQLRTHNIDDVTRRPWARDQYTSSRDNVYEDDGCCCCCFGSTGKTAGYSGTTGGYTSRNNYNTSDYPGGYARDQTGDITDVDNLSTFGDGYPGGYYAPTNIERPYFASSRADSADSRDADQGKPGDDGTGGRSSDHHGQHHEHDGTSGGGVGGDDDGGGGGDDGGGGGDD